MTITINASLQVIRDGRRHFRLPLPARRPLISVHAVPAMASSAAGLIFLLLLLASSASQQSQHKIKHHELGPRRRSAEEAATVKKTIHLAGIFPINGIEGWQGGQVRLHETSKPAKLIPAQREYKIASPRQQRLSRSVRK